MIEVNCLYVSPQAIIDFSLVQISAEEKKGKKGTGQEACAHIQYLND